jgi:sulfopyruvate decarboxylase TPP-binding subunit
MADNDTDAPEWPHALYGLLRANGITQFAYVPDAGHKVLIDRSLADPDAHSVPLTTEEEGVALLAGADLGGQRGVLLMQSSGVGNCINLLSLIAGCRFPLLTLVRCAAISGRGIPGNFPWARRRNRC